MFKKNIGSQGKIIRLIFAILLLIYSIWQKSWIALIFSIFTFFEAFMSWCIVYQMLGKNSCPIESNKEDMES